MVIYYQESRVGIIRRVGWAILKTNLNCDQNLEKQPRNQTFLRGGSKSGMVTQMKRLPKIGTLN